MCGVYAAIDFSKALNGTDQTILNRMSLQLAPRGPDSSGQWISPCGHVALGHRRLAIVDLTPSGQQPMHDVSGRFSIVFNGEIFNYRDLRQELESGFTFRTSSDTEVIIAAWQRWGESCLKKLRGMFAFVIWDNQARVAHVARDAFGIKPIYVRRVGSQLWIASQVKALTLVAPDLTENLTAKAGFFLWGSVPDPHTPFNEIIALNAGHVISFSSDSFDVVKARDWFNFSQTFSDAADVKTASNLDIANDLRSAMLDTVSAHREADVSVGVFLSAGLDSTTLAALSCEIAGTNHVVQTVTLSFKEYVGTENDESILAEAVARQLGTQHTTVQISKNDFADELPKLFAAMDQPSYDGVNTYFVSKATHQAGLKVALSGLGGDELFGGYPSFRQVPKLANSLPAFLQQPGAIARYLFAGFAGRLGVPKLAGVFEYGGSFERAYLLRRALFMPWELDRIMSESQANNALSELATLPALEATHRASLNPQTKVTLLEAAWFMRHQLLRDSDWASMAHGLELRVPLVDVNLWKAVLPLRASSTPVSKKQMAMTPRRALPDVILNRPKTGFSIPVGRWLAEAENLEFGKSNSGGLRHWAHRVWERWLDSVPRYEI